MFLSIENISKQYFLVYFERKHIKITLQFFNVNQGVTSSEKSLLWQFCNNYGHSSGLESLSFYPEHQKTIFQGLFGQKTKKDQILNLQLKPWINPFGKITTMTTL